MVAGPGDEAGHADHPRHCDAVDVSDDVPDSEPASSLASPAESPAAADVPQAPDAPPGVEPPGVAAPESRPLELSPLPAHTATAAPRDITSLFARIAVTRTADGGVRIEAPPSAAAELSQLLVGLAGLLQAASADPGAL